MTSEGKSDNTTVIVGGSVGGVVILILVIALVVVYRKYRHSMNYPVHVVAPRFGPSYDYEEGYTDCVASREDNEESEQPFSDYTTDIPDYLQTSSRENDDYYDEDGDGDYVQD